MSTVKLTPVRNTKREAESDIDINVSTSSPAKRVKAVTESDTPSQHTSEMKSETSEATATGPEPQPKMATPVRETKIEICYAPASSAPAPPTPTSPNQSKVHHGGAGAAARLVATSASGALSRCDNGDEYSPSHDSDYVEDEYDGAFEGYDGNDYDDPADYATPPEEPEEENDEDEENESNGNHGMDDYYNGADLEFSDLIDDYNSFDDYNPLDGYECDGHGPALREPVGLLNGCYGITAPSVVSAFENLDASELSLVLKLRDTELWGDFDLGLVGGTLYFDERPWHASGEPLMFKWRGFDVDGRLFKGDDNNGHIQFLGSGRIRGVLNYDGEDVQFDGYRTSGENTKSGTPVWEMQKQWNELI